MHGFMRGRGVPASQWVGAAARVLGGGRLAARAAAVAAGIVGAIALLGAGTAAAAGDNPVLYVAENATGSCISQFDPCGTISQALALAAPGARIYLQGTLVGAVTIDQSVTISGAYPGGGEPAAIDGASEGSVVTVDGGSVTLDDLTIEHGDAGFDGGGILNDGGTVAVTDSTITDNNAADAGGGISNDAGSISVTNSTIADNGAGLTSAGIAGGIVNGSSAGPISVTDSTIADNISSFGGGIVEASDGGPITVTDSTITGNEGSFGGGISDAGSGGSVTVLGSTIAGNSGTDGAQVYFSQSFTVGASIISGSFGSDCYTDIPIHDLGYNLSDDSTDGCRFTATTDVLGQGADLGPLGYDAAGLIEIRAPNVGSPAVGVIPDPTTLDGVQACGGTATDEIGQSRPINTGTSCTIGAVEEPVSPAPVVVTASQTYGSSSPSFTTATAAPGGDSFSGTLSCQTINGGTDIEPTLAVGGSYTIDGSSCRGLTLTGPTASAYSITYTGSTFTVNPAPVTVDTPSATAEYGAVPSSFAPTYTGLVNGQSAPQTPASCTSNATDTSLPGSYSMTCSGAKDPDYAISYNPPGGTSSGGLTITKAGTRLAAAAAKRGLLSLTFSATLTRADHGAAISGETIAFAAAGRTVCRATTNSSGVASCKVIRLLTGSGIYTASFAGDSGYQPSQATGTL